MNDNFIQSSKQSSTLELVIRWGVYFTALIPLIIWRDYFSAFHFGKIIIFRSLIEILLILYLILVFRDKRFLPKWDILLWVITAFTGTFLLTSITSVNVYQSFMGTLERMGGWFSFAHYWIFLIISISVIRTKEQWFNFLYLSVVASFVSFVYGFLQKAPLVENIYGSGNRARIFGTLGNAAIFAGYQLTNVFLAGILYFTSDERWYVKRGWYVLAIIIYLFLIMIPVLRSGRDLPIFYWIIASVGFIGLGLLVWFKDTPQKAKLFFALIFVLNVVAVFMTAVRGAILGLFVGLLILAFLYIRIKSYRRLGLVFLLGVIIIGGLEIFLITQHDTSWVQNSGYLNRISDVSLETRTVKTRLWAWQAGIDGWNDSTKTILFGWGPENFNIPFSIHFNPLFYNGPGAETFFDRAHNSFVNNLVTMGLVGFITYISIFITLFVYLVRLIRSNSDTQKKMVATTLLAGLIAYIGHIGTFFDTSANFIVFFMIIGFVHFLKRENNKEDARTSGQLVRPILGNVIVLFLIIAVAVSLYKTSIRQVYANKKGVEAVVSAGQGRYNDALTQFDFAYNLNIFDKYTLLNGTDRYVQFVLNNIQNLSKAGADPVRALLSIIKYEDELIKRSEQDYLPHMYKGLIYAVLGNNNPETNLNDLAIESTQKVLDISPTFIRAYYNMSQAYENKGEKKIALMWLERAKELNPEVGITTWFIGRAHYGMGEKELGLNEIKKSFELGYTPTEPELISLIDPFLKIRDLDTLVDIYERLIKANPSNPQYYASLISTHAQLGNRESTIETAQLMISVFPKTIEEVRNYLLKAGISDLPF